MGSCLVCFWQIDKNEHTTILLWDQVEISRATNSNTNYTLFRGGSDFLVDGFTAGDLGSRDGRYAERQVGKK